MNTPILIVGMNRHHVGMIMPAMKARSRYAPRMTRIGRVVIGAGVCLALAAPAWAQSTVDLRTDPVTWLKTYLGGAACVVYEAGPTLFCLERVNVNTEVQFDGCRMVLQQASVEGADSELRTLRIPLGALAPNSVTSREGFFLPEGWTSRGDVPTHTITIAAPAGRSLIEERIEHFDDTAPRDYRTDVITILVRHEENAIQIVQALTRAIELCRER